MPCRAMSHAWKGRTSSFAQVQAKDKQIDALLDRDRETNLLINGLQRMLGPLLPSPDRDTTRGAE